MDENMKKKNVFLIPQLILPIPSVKGGAIETLISNLIYENEIEKKINLFVVSVYDEKASMMHFDNTRIFYFKDGRYVGKESKMWRLQYYLYKPFAYLFKNRITRRLFSKNKYRMDYLTFQYYKIAKKYHVDFISIEGDENETALSNLCKLVGRDRVYNHIHYTRYESQFSRSLIPNSISISAYVKAKWTNEKSTNENDVVLMNGIDVDTFSIHYDGEKKSNMRKQLGLKDDGIVVLFCGRIMPEKGVEQLLEAFSIIDDTRIILLLAGGPPASKSNVKNEFYEYVTNKASAMNNVIALGQVPYDILPQYYAISDLQVIPTTCEEGAGLIAIEGMAAGLPQVITLSGGMPEYSTSDCAIQLPIDDNLPQNIADAVNKLANNPELRSKMGNCGRERAKLYTTKAYYHSFVDIVENACKG